MPVNARKFAWSDRKRRCAQLVAEDRLTNDKIAKEVGIDQKTLTRWKKTPEFVTYVDGIIDSNERRIARTRYGRRSRRIAELAALFEALVALRIARAADPAMKKVPGGKQGVLVHSVKSVGSGDNAERVDLYRLDAAQVRESRELLKQIAQECGHWVQKVAPTSPDGEEQFGHGFTDEERAALIATISARLGLDLPGQADAGGGEAERSAVDQSQLPFSEGGAQPGPVAETGPGFQGDEDAFPL